MKKPAAAALPLAPPPSLWRLFLGFFIMGSTSFMSSKATKEAGTVSLPRQKTFTVSAGQTIQHTFIE